MIDRRVEENEYKRLRKQLEDMGAYSAMIDEQIRVTAKTSALMLAISERLYDEYEYPVEEVASNGGSKREANPLIDVYEKVHKIICMDLDRLGLNRTATKKVDAPTTKKPKSIMDRIIGDGDAE